MTTIPTSTTVGTKETVSNFEEEKADIINHVIGKRRKDKKRTKDQKTYRGTNSTPQKGSNEGIPPQSEKVKTHYETSYQSVSAGKMKIQRQEQLYQERERERRATNVIIHGLEEKREVHDRDQIKKLFMAIDVTSTPKSLTRLGSPSKHEMRRPLKLVLNTLEEKTMLMKKAPRLKFAEGDLKKISITHDFTINQRKEIAKKVKIAREKTARNNGKYVWKVKGSSWEEMKVIRLNTTSTTNEDSVSNNAINPKDRITKETNEQESKRPYHQDNEEETKSEEVRRSQPRMIYK